MGTAASISAAAKVESSSSTSTSGRDRSTTHAALSQAQTSIKEIKNGYTTNYEYKKDEPAPDRKMRMETFLVDEAPDKVIENIKMKKMALGIQGYKDVQRDYDGTLSQVELNRSGQVLWTLDNKSSTGSTVGTAAATAKKGSGHDITSMSKESTSSSLALLEIKPDGSQHSLRQFIMSPPPMNSPSPCKDNGSSSNLYPYQQQLQQHMSHTASFDNKAASSTVPRGLTAAGHLLNANQQQLTSSPQQPLLVRPYPGPTGGLLPPRGSAEDLSALTAMDNPFHPTFTSPLKTAQFAPPTAAGTATATAATNRGNGSNNSRPATTSSAKGPPPNPLSSIMTSPNSNPRGPPTLGNNINSNSNHPNPHSHSHSTGAMIIPAARPPPSSSAPLPVVKETKDIKRNKAQLPVNLTHAKPVTGDWLNKRHIVNNYILLDTLGSGSYAEVRLCKDRTTEKLYAIKIISKDFLNKKKNGRTDETYFEDIKREIAIMKKLLHPNILRLYEVLDDPKVNKMYLVLEYMKKGDLINMLKQQKTINSTVEGEFSPLSDMQIWHIFKQLVAGIRYLHFQNIVHGDIKPHNLLLGENGLVKIADFGISQMLSNDNEQLADAAGTPAFMAPELCSLDKRKEQRFNGQLADVWAIGATIFMLRFGRPPFVAKSIIHLYKKIVEDPLVFPSSANASDSSLDPGLRNLLEGTLEKDPLKRMTMDMLAHHPWFHREPSLQIEQMERQQRLLRGQGQGQGQGQVQGQGQGQQQQPGSTSNANNSRVPSASQQQQQLPAINNSSNRPSTSGAAAISGRGGGNNRNDMSTAPNIQPQPLPGPVYNKAAAISNSNNSNINPSGDILGGLYFQPPSTYDEEAALAMQGPVHRESVGAHDLYMSIGGISPYHQEGDEEDYFDGAVEEIAEEEGEGEEDDLDLDDDDDDDDDDNDNRAVSNKQRKADKNNKLAKKMAENRRRAEEIETEAEADSKQQVQQAKPSQPTTLLSLDSKYITMGKDQKQQKESLAVDRAGEKDSRDLNNNNLMATNWGADIFEMVDDGDGDDHDAIDSSDDDDDIDEDEKGDHFAASNKVNGNGNKNKTSSKGKLGSNKSASSISNDINSSDPHQQSQQQPRRGSAHTEMTEEEEAQRSMRFIKKINRKSSQDSMTTTPMSPVQQQIANIQQATSSRPTGPGAPPPRNNTTNTKTMNVNANLTAACNNNMTGSSGAFSSSNGSNASNSNKGSPSFKQPLSGQSRRYSMTSTADDNDGDYLDPEEMTAEDFSRMMDTLAQQPADIQAKQRHADQEIIEAISSSNEVTARLEEIIAPQQNSRIKVGAAFCSEQGIRPSQEDRCVLIPCAADMSALKGYDLSVPVMDSLGMISIVCIFDGHNGFTSSQHLAQFMPGLLVTHDQFLDSKQLSQAIQQTCSSVDYQLCKMLRDEDDPSGSTGVIAVYDGRRKVLTVAGIGDSLCVLCRAGRAVEMNKMHRLTDNQAERERVKAAGGTIINNRVNAVLAVSRAFGDTQFKAQNLSTPSLVTAVPEITSQVITAMTEFALLATDGLWDVMSPQVAISYTRAKLLANHNLQSAARDLVHEALARGSVDNVTVVLMTFNSKIVSPPQQT